MADMRLKPIGRVVSREGEVSLALDPRYAMALEGLEGFSHVQVLWWFDECDNEADRASLSSDKPYTRGPARLGTFATRSPQRPNPLALSTARLIWLDREGAKLGLDYIDALDGTPILDIKPYTPSLDRVEAPEVPAWCAHWPGALEDSGEFDWEKEFNF